MNRFEVGISRHAPKHDKPKEEGYEVSSQEVDKEAADKEVVPVVKEMLDRFRAAPGGSIMALQPSNILRAQQTQELLTDKVAELLNEGEAIELVALEDDKEAADKLLDRIRAEGTKKFIISDLRGTELLGFKEKGESVDAVNKWKNRFGGDENFIGKLRAMRTQERDLLHKQIEDAGIEVGSDELNPAEFVSTPEEDALRQIRWMKAMKKIGENHFPNRPLYLEGISHNIRADFTSLALLGEDISVESIDRVLGGKFRKPFERSSVVFDDAVTVNYKDTKKKYNTEEFEGLIQELYKKSYKRQEEWGK